MAVELLDPDSKAYRHAFARRAALQRQRHKAQPHTVPLYLGCDDDEFPSDDTFGMPEEEDA